MSTAPIFKITDLHIRGLRGLQKLNLPQDGMGWEHGFPPVSVIGGANGSGKTTLLRCITEAARTLGGVFNFFQGQVPAAVAAEECRIDFEIADKGGKALKMRFLVGDVPFVGPLQLDEHFGYVRIEGVVHPRPHRELRLNQWGGAPGTYAATTFPRLVFFPSDERDLAAPPSSHAPSQRLDDDAGFVVEWKRDGHKQWSGSLFELLFAARWADLNAKELGKPEEAKNFDRYTKAFSDLTLGEKRLAWTTKGDLVIELRSGTQHSLQELSSGERQALLLLAELRRFWRPGSLVLIDELELHLHDAWQGKLYDVIKAMQVELGGQVIITTQSHSLFEMADLGTRALIGRGSLR